MISPPKPRKGHGAISNPEGRFESRHVEAVDDGWTGDSDAEPSPVATTVTAERAKSVISRNDSPDISFEQSINPYRGCGHACVYCMLGDTNIQLASGRTKLLGDLEIGDEIVGTARRGNRRRYVVTRVLAHWETHKPAYRLMLADGTTITASADHRFLTERGWKFVTGAEQGPKQRPYLTTGTRLMGMTMGSIDPTSFFSATAGHMHAPTAGLWAVIEKPITCPGSFPADCAGGFRGAIFDAEGIGGNACVRIADSNHSILDRAAERLEHLGLGFAYEVTGRGMDRSGHCLRVIDGLRQQLRFFPPADPALARRRDIFGQAVKSDAALRIVEIEPLGVSMPMYDITTGTGDFIANGVISHNCYARPAHSYVNLSPGLDFETKLFYKENAALLLEEELRQPSYVCKSINLGANTDPYQPIERTLKVTRSILEVLQRFRHPVTIVTKGQLIERDIDILSEMARDNLAAVHVSVTTLDSSLKRALEPRAPSAAARLHAIRSLNAAGVPVGTLVAPVIPAINDHEIEHILAAVAQAGARTAAYVMLRLPYEVKDLFREWLAAHYPLRAAHVMSLVNDLRGGRDNDPSFGSRMRGTGPLAELMRRRFEVACRKLNLNTARRAPLDTRLFRPPPLAGTQLDLGF